MRDLKFAEAAKVALLSHRRRTYAYQSVQESHDAYTGNLGRARRLLIVPGYAFMTGRALGTAEVKTEYAPVLRGSLFADIMDRIFLDQMDNMHRETADLEKIASVGMSIIHDALEDTLISVVGLAWAAFEVLLKQLVDKSVAEHPQCFPHLTGSEFKGFMKREFFRKTYEAYFPGGTRIQNLLGDESVDALCVLRNLIAHSSGYVDSSFKTESEEIDCVAWATLPVGDRFEFMGDIIWNLVDRNAQNAYRLQDAVNDWLAAHEPKP